MTIRAHWRERTSLGIAGLLLRVGCHHGSVGRHARHGDGHHLVVGVDRLGGHGGLLLLLLLWGHHRRALGGQAGGRLHRLCLLWMGDRHTEMRHC